MKTQMSYLFLFYNFQLEIFAFNFFFNWPIYSTTIIILLKKKKNNGKYLKVFEKNELSFGNLFINLKYWYLMEKIFLFLHVFSSLVQNDDLLKILLVTDTHLGFMERDPVRGNDSFQTFEEILKLANKLDVCLLKIRKKWMNVF